MSKIMRIYQTLFWLVVCSMLSTICTAADYTAILEDVATNPVSRGDFNQERRVAVLSRPLLSSGKYTVSRDQGLIWQQNKPFESLLVITPQAMIEQVAGGEARRIDFSRQPLMKAITEVFLGVLAGNASVLERNFTVVATIEKKQWSLSLTPKATGLERFVKLITVRGQGKLIQKVNVVEISGDQLDVTFQSQQMAATLDANEIKLFTTKP